MSNSLTSVDWSTIPAPIDDGGADHLAGMSMPVVSLPSTQGGDIDLFRLSGTTVIYIYPMTGPPSGVLPDGWNELPGARGCSPQSCSFRDHYDELRELGARNVFGLSTQATPYQQEAATRLHLPFPLLSDSNFECADALNLPRFEADGKTLLKRLTIIARATRIMKVFYPVFPPDQNAEDVMTWLKDNPL